MSTRGKRQTQPLTLELEPWAHEELAREAREREMTPQDLAAFAIAYYLADRDSGRIARRTPPPRTDPA